MRCDVMRCATPHHATNLTLMCISQPVARLVSVMCYFAAVPRTLWTMAVRADGMAHWAMVSAMASAGEKCEWGGG